MTLRGLLGTTPTPPPDDDDDDDVVTFGDDRGGGGGGGGGEKGALTPTLAPALVDTPSPVANPYHARANAHKANKASTGKSRQGKE